MAALDSLAVIAGKGDLPLEVARSAAERGIKVCVFVLRDQGDPSIYQREFPTEIVRIGAAGESIARVRSHGIRDLVFAGGVRRPSLMELMPDATATKVLGHGLLRMGDDGLLKAVLAYLENKEGFRVHPVQDFLQDALPKEGLVASTAVSEPAQADITKGCRVLALMAEGDVGQAVAIQDGLVLAVEAIEGTDAMIARAGSLKRDGRGPVLVKMSKRQQTERADLPTIGPDTVRTAIAAGFSGIAVEAGRSLLLKQQTCRELADAAGLFLVAIPGNMGAE